MGSGLGIEYERLFYAFMNADPIEFPVVASIYQTFDAHARTMMDGAPQFSGRRSGWGFGGRRTNTP